MDNTQHTPGPWHVGYSPETNGPTILVTGKRGATYIIAPEIYGTASGEPEANAQLMATAPEMLAALEAISTWLIAPSTSKVTRSHFRNIAERAIATAKGEEDDG